MIIVLDNVLSENELNNFNEGTKTNISFDFNLINHLRKWNEIKFCHPLLKITSKYFPLRWNYRYELWKHPSKEYVSGHDLEWHIDKDEELLQKESILEVPLFGLIYYPFISNLKGGQLHLEDETIIVPRSNRMVLFSTGTIQHMVHKYEGHRYAVLINIWNKKNLGYSLLNIRLHV